VSDPSSEAQKPAAPTWGLHDQLAKLKAYDPAEVVGERRMGVGMSFAGADTAVRDVAETVEELRLDWDRLGPTRQSQVATEVSTFVNLIDAVLKMDSSKVDTTQEGTSWTPEQVRQQRDAWANEIQRLHLSILDNVRPLCVSAPARRAAENYVREETASLSESQVSELRQTFAELKEQAQEFERLRPVVEAQRELLGAAGTTRISGHFEEEADAHSTAWKWWLGALVVWLVVAGIAGVVFIDQTRPMKDATNAQTATHIFLDLLVIGLLIFVVRILSLQFRAHRHMEIVARNKANALSTFNLLIVGMEPEVKSAVAAALAQSVFSTDDSIFADASTEHVTILERVLSPGIERLKQ
jgi:hypothetical protein